jgi:hypothetical protein
VPDDVPVHGAFVHRDLERAVAVADAAGSTDVVQQLNALLAALRAAGIIAPNEPEGE